MLLSWFDHTVPFSSQMEGFEAKNSTSEVEAFKHHLDQIVVEVDRVNVLELQ